MSVHGLGSRLALLCVSSLVISLTACQASRAGSRPAAMLFDDFSYDSYDEFSRNGWIVRTASGWPGVAGATWNDAVSFLDDSTRAGNRLVRLTAQTDGTTTKQAQFCHQRKYLEGTYAARVRFSDRPVAGPDGDQIVQTFYTIAPLRAVLDPDYSEQDFEYLPNGGWGGRPADIAHDQLGNVSAGAVAGSQCQQPPNGQSRGLAHAGATDRRS